MPIIIIKFGWANVTMSAYELDSDGQVPNQGSRVAFLLSQLIVSGEVVAGEKLAEIPLAERFGVSRTPVRHAFAVLEKEGLLIRDSGRSYVVRRFSLEEILNGIEVKAALEGLAAREVAQRRLRWELLRELEIMLAEADETIREIEAEGPTARLTERYFKINSRFHRAIIAAAGNRTIIQALELTSKIPFVSVGSIARYRDSADDDAATALEKTHLLLFGHMQHKDIFDALKGGLPARAETLMREHGYLGIRNLRLRDHYPAELPIGSGANSTI
jgi:GntR family transcriptional regulator of vanillate catabolism